MTIIEMLEQNPAAITAAVAEHRKKEGDTHA
jgi:hypothetical protein